jgi:hypothetical protein
MKFLAILKAVISLLPLIIDGIKALEEAIPGQGKGEQRLAALRGILESTFAVATDLGVTFGDVWPAIEKTVGTLVKVFNDSGIFKK